MMFPKHNYVRSKKLLENARKIPCQHCLADDGTVVAAHSNQLIHGKGRGIKASDEYIASLCFHCHSQLDQGASMTKAERQEMWEDAHRLTVTMLRLRGLWPDDVPLPKGFS
jgi:hypothetical protein